MQILVAKNDLTAALQTAAIAMATAGGDFTSHFLFRAKGSHAEVLTTNNRVFATVPFVCTVTGDLTETFTVEGWRLRQWLGGVADGTVTLDFDGAVVTARSGRGAIRYKSYDPSKFPLWDETLEQAVQVAEVEAERLHSALAYAKLSISDQENRSPAISVMENKDGSLFATDQSVVAVIAVTGLDESKLRVHGKDAPDLLAFLSGQKGEKIKVLEHDRCLILQRTDGTLFGVARPTAGFPNLNIDRDAVEPTNFTINCADMIESIAQLSSAAAVDDRRIRFRYDAEDGKIVLSVASSADGEDALSIVCTDADGMDLIPDTGFVLSHVYISKIISHFGSETLRFGVNKKGRGGWVRFSHEKLGDKYLSVAVWILDKS